MIRRLILALLATLSVTAHAREIYYIKPKALDAPTAFCDTLNATTTSFDYHFRVELPIGANRSNWQFALAMPDSAQVMINLESIGRHDPLYGNPLTITVTDSDCNGVPVRCREFHITQEIEPSSTAWSLKIVKKPEYDSVYCAIGQKRPLLEFNVAEHSPSSICTNVLSDMSLSRLSLISDSPAELITSKVFANLGQLNDYLAQSTDVAETYWSYLDRNTDMRRIDLGGNYVLATVAADDGGYDIFYISGARVNADNWRPLMLKGHLKPTIFINHYDLQWRDAQGRIIADEASADITDGAMLTLNLPLYGGTVRFQKSLTTLAR